MDTTSVEPSPTPRARGARLSSPRGGRSPTISCRSDLRRIHRPAHRRNVPVYMTIGRRASAPRCSISRARSSGRGRRGDSLDNTRDRARLGLLAAAADSRVEDPPRGFRVRSRSAAELLPAVRAVAGRLSPRARARLVAPRAAWPRRFARSSATACTRRRYGSAPRRRCLAIALERGEARKLRRSADSIALAALASCCSRTTGSFTVPLAGLPPHVEPAPEVSFRPRRWPPSAARAGAPPWTRPLSRLAALLREARRHRRPLSARSRSGGRSAGDRVQKVDKWFARSTSERRPLTSRR